MTEEQTAPQNVDYRYIVTNCGESYFEIYQDGSIYTEVAEQNVQDSSDEKVLLLVGSFPSVAALLETHKDISVTEYPNTWFALKRIGQRCITGNGGPCTAEDDSLPPYEGVGPWTYELNR